METDVDIKIRLNQNYRGSRASWSLQEFDQNEGKWSEDLIPWDLWESFSASEIHLTHTIKNNRETGIVAESKGIYGILGPSQRTPYLMMGTNRRIERFPLSVQMTDERFNEEVCYLWGALEHRDYWTFETSEDEVGVTILLNPERFHKLAGIVESGGVSSIKVSLRNVPGFFAPPSGPDIFADYIKILTDDSDQKVIIPEDCEIDPPRLGIVEEFELSVSQGNHIGLGNENFGSHQDPGNDY